MSIKLKIFTFAAAIHLLLSVLSAAHFGEWGVDRRIVDPLYYCGEFTGSSNIYSFFAPFVGEQVSVLYTLADSSGKQQPWMLEGPNREINTRITTIYNFLNLPEGKDLFCRSFGNNALRLNPNVTITRVCVIQQRMPSLEMFRDSMQIPRWEPVSTHDYARLNQ